MKILILSKKNLLALHLMRCLSDSNAECHVFGEGMLWPIVFSKYCCRYSYCDFGTSEMSQDAVLSRINDYCKRYEISLVIASDCETGYVLSRIKDRLSPGIMVFPVAEADTLEVLDNKWKFIQMLKENHLPHPRTALAENAAQLEAIDTGFPCLLKPLKCSGGQPSTYLKLNKEDYLASGKAPAGFPLLVQEFIPGMDIGLNVLALKGKLVAWTMQKYLDPSTLQFFESEELLRLGRQIVELTQYHGVANFDLRIDARDHSLKFTECNPRFWRSLRASRWNGVNFATLGILLAQGGPLPMASASKNVFYVLPSHVITCLAKGKISVLKNIPPSTRSDLRQMFLDPFSLIASFMPRGI